MAKHRHEILEGANLDHYLLRDEQGAQLQAGAEAELDLSAEQRKAMVAAGWISEPLDSDDSKGKKGGKG